MKQKLMITGASGFLGAHLLMQAYHKWDSMAIYRTKKYNLPGHWIQTDLTDYVHVNSMIEKNRPDVLIHCAATTDLEFAEQHPELAYQNNVLVTRNLAEICQRLNIRFILISTDMLFDGTEGLYDEAAHPNPLNYYGKTKLEAEQSIQPITENYVIARSALIYGISRTASCSFCEIMLQNWKAGEPVNLFHDEYRSPVLVNNLAQALLELAVIDYVGTIHLGGDERISRLEFGMVFAKLFAVPSHLVISKSMQDVDFKAKRPVDTSFDIHLAKSLLDTKIMNCYEGAHYLKDRAFV
jgi:dTDP-4-dehydrorhamnose reductase